MTNASRKPSFEPILLDLADDDDYAVLIHALEEYHGVMQGEADNERDRIRFENLPESASAEEEYQSLADRATRIREEIERQIDANAAARNEREQRKNDDP